MSDGFITKRFIWKEEKLNSFNLRGLKIIKENQKNILRTATSLDELSMMKGYF